MAFTLRTRTTLLLIFSGLIIIFIIALFFYVKSEFFKTKTIITDDVMIEKITSMGKLELVKYSMKDVIEKKEVRRILPDQRILFVAAGEVTGCIDLTKVGKADIQTENEDSITVTLPKAEICYAKLDHSRSRVYDVSGAWFPSDAKEMVEGIYKIAEQKILQNAKEMNILTKAEDNARTIFRPFLENISGKKVGIRFK